MNEHFEGAMDASEGRKFGVVLGGAFGALAGLLWWRDHSAAATVMTVISVALLLGALAAPDRLGPVRSRWMQLSALISRVTTPVFMAVIYFVVITPIGLLARVVGHRPLRHGRDGSAWVRRDAGRRRSDLQRQF
jgi:hypothetical protein